ncbi:MAG: CotH kinase family protein [Verrucomicrobia bacterium]|nr:CotH kinase family protein [Verrucomicrobiota bacterium]
MPHFTLVRYWFTARDAMGNAYRSPSEKLPVPFHGFFVEERDSAKTLPVYSLRLLGSDLAAMQANSWNNQTFPATLVVKQEVYDSVRIRVRGAFARSWPKKSFKILFEKGNLFGNRSRINLNSGWRDPAFIREILSYRIYRDSGAFSLNAEPVFVRVNGQFLGLFTAIEQPDKRYLDSQGISGAVLYKADSGNNVSDERNLGDANSFRQHYEKETDEEEPYDDLAEFCRDLEQTRKVKEFFEARVDLPRYVNFLCATTLCQNWDGYNKNHFIGVDRENSGKWFAIPWDLDRTLGDHWNGHFDETRLPLLLGIRDLPGVTGWNRMADRFFSDPHLRKLYKERLNELLESVFTEANLYPIVESLRQKISAAADMDHEKWRSAWNASRGVDEVKLFIRDRRVFLLGELERF